MGFLMPGIYCNGNEQYDFELLYYMKYYLNSIEVALFYMFDIKIMKETMNLGIFENDAAYYHFYTDHLLYCMGQIAMRFVEGNEKQNEVKRRIEINKRALGVNEDKYPILCDKRYRNSIEHIFNRNIDIIVENGQVGGFNFINNQTEYDIRKNLYEEKNKYVCILDITNKMIQLNNKGNWLELDIDKLQKEVKELKKNVDCNWNMLREHIK
ncbi:hypothetical protein SAMN02745111_01690 [Eubacterium uniforme]|uniref:Uncharacterized protein n=1 Tax=Eubacterium uniforme TaxID=39495 RepID=A0A1T4VVG2_9FIRM|nr:hypothetical protein [Eubacterium uniforme]SKA68937.1 hypothetical protein SAMN02745111_01690 [Eubacterium uniforme]